MSVLKDDLYKYEYEWNVRFIEMDTHIDFDELMSQRVIDSVRYCLLHASGIIRNGTISRSGTMPNYSYIMSEIRSLKMET